MRIVIEIDSGELVAATVHPSAGTTAFAQVPAAPEVPGIPRAVIGVEGELEPSAADAGPAPVEGPLSDEPVAFAPAAPVAEPEAIDAGPAPIEGLLPDEPAAFTPTTVPTAPVAEPETIDAGPAPSAGLPSDESVAPTPPLTVSSVPIAEPPAEDAGAAPEALISGEVTEVGVAPEPADFVNDAGPAAVMVGEGAGGVPAAETAPDDLTAIDGIGPKISRILREDGITTFEQLAACDVDYLQQLLADAGVAANTETWPEQAAVAATGDLDALHALQARLKKNR